MDLSQAILLCLIEVCVFWFVTDGQVLMEELRKYDIDPLNFNGTEAYTDLTLDQIIMQVSGGPGMAQNLVRKEDGKVLAELDMLLTQQQFFALYEEPVNLAMPLRGKRNIRMREKAKRRNKRKAIRDTILRWTDAVMPYSFANYHFEGKEEYMIQAAMTEWEKYTCVKFKPAKRSDRNVVRFQNGMGCNSQLGMVGGTQALNLDKHGCRFKGLYLHEIGHALGLVHEHQLPDRDRYIEILYHNVEPQMRVWFNKYSSQEVNQMSVPYEYSSVMHYGITAFSADGKSKTIQVREKGKEESIGRVYRKELSFTDVKIVNLMYNCSAHCSKTIVCNDGGFVDQNCKCICPDGTDSCTKSKASNEDRSCANAHDSWQCNVWANQGECERNPRFMMEGCRKACKLCGEKDTKGDDCKDVFSQEKCQAWKDRGDCIVNKKWMHRNCRQTCKACANSGTDPEVECENKHQDEKECEKWASEGECQINTVWMPENCRKSCHMCDQSSRPTEAPEPTSRPDLCEDQHNTVECKGWADAGECTANPDWMIPNCRKSCGKCGGTAEECKNVWDDRQCEGWARDQECMKNGIWMYKNCHKSCTKCEPDTDVTVATTVAPRTTKGSGESCVNNHRNEHECDSWAKHGHCNINQWMKVHCKKSCRVCVPEVTVPVTTPKPDNKDKDKEHEDPDCQDQNVHCRTWQQHGFCEDNPGTALRICKKSCNTCRSRRECFDMHQLCPLWAKDRQCQQNSGYMLKNCVKSCGMCG